MTRYRAEPQLPAGTAPCPGVLLVNLGSPQAPTAAAVRDFLREFLSDPRVVELPRALWLPLLYAGVLTVRPAASARRYGAVWTPEGSPLAVHTARQAVMLRGYLGERTRARIEVQWAMRYGTPGIRAGLDALRARGCDRILILPLYPQYAASTTAAVSDAVHAAVRVMRNVPALRYVRDFHDHPGYIGALAQSVRDHWMRNGRPNVLVMSFHGIPRQAVDRGDPYLAQCHASARLLAEALALPTDGYRVAFQSRFGKARWLEPYTAPLLQQLGRQRTGRVDVICPGFVADCLETLEEIAIEGKTLYLQAGGEAFHYIECLDERDDWLRALTDLVVANLQGWLPAA